MQNSVISTRITSLYGSQASSVVFACKTATSGPELQVSIGTTLLLSLCTCKTAWLAPEKLVSIGSSPHLLFLDAKQPEKQVSMGFRPHLSYYVCKTARLAPELLVSMGPCPHLWFLHAKQRLLYQKNRSLWVPDITYHFVHAKQRD